MKISPSQIEKYRRCKRLYAFEYVEGFFPPPSTKQEFGTAVHKEIENWLTKAVDFSATSAGAVAKQGFQWLPLPDTRLLVEQEIVVPWRDSVNLFGYIDCVVPPECTADGVPLILDHKSTSDLRWAMTASELTHDAQVVVYSIWTMLKFQSSRVRARWVYYSAGAPKNGERVPTGAKPVEVVLDRRDPEFVEEVNKLAMSVEEIMTIRESKIKGADIEPSLDACAAYGGCPHKDRCGLTMDQKIARYFG